MMTTPLAREGAESSKLFELRAKTDRQLVAYLTRRLDAGMRFACAEHSLPQSEAVYAEVSALLPLVRYHLIAERRRLEERAARLRNFLNDLSSDAELVMQTACS